MILLFTHTYTSHALDGDSDTLTSFYYLQSSENLRIVPVDEAPVQGIIFFGLVFISVWVLGNCTIISMTGIFIVYVSLSLAGYVADNFSHASLVSICLWRETVVTEQSEVTCYFLAVLWYVSARGFVRERYIRFPNSSRCPVQS